MRKYYKIKYRYKSQDIIWFETTNKKEAKKKINEVINNDVFSLTYYEYYR